MEGRPAQEWLQYLLTIRLGDDADSDQYRAGIRAMRQIERWLRDNRRPRALFDLAGRPKSQLVSVSFARDEMEMAMAYRVFCSRLGLGAALRHSRIRHNACPRTTPRS